MAKSPKNKNYQSEARVRSKYRDHSQKFRDWVDQLGFEQTFFGRFAQRIDQKYNVRKVSVLFLYCLILSFLLFFDFDFQQSAHIGEIAKKDFKSPIAFTMIDEVATEKKRTDAEAQVPPIFDYDPEAFRGITEPVYVAFREMRELVRETKWPKKELDRDEKIKEFLTNKPKFEDIMGRKVTNRLFEWLVEKRFSVLVENVIKNALTEWTSYKIIDAPINLIKEKSSLIVLKEVTSKTNSSIETQAQYNDLKDIQKPEDFVLSDIRGVNRLSVKDKKNVFIIAKSLLIANVTFNKSETAERRQKARESVLPVQVSIGKNQVIVNQGSVIQPIHLTIFNEIKKRQSDRRVDFISLVTAVLLVVTILVFLSFTRRFTLNQVQVSEKELVVMALVTMTTIVITKFFLFMMDAAFVSRFELSPTTFLYVAPVAAAPMIVGMLVTSGEIVWLFNIFFSIVLAVMMDMNFGFFSMALIGGVAASRGVFNCEKRNDIYWAGLRTGLVNGVVVLLVVSLSKVGAIGYSRELALNVPAAFLGGILSSLVTMALIPFFESSFNFTTDIKLLELSNLNHPLMTEMVVKAPGTYHHSLVVGSMVESAAKEIGANALLGKVMAYYHDIGKMDHAQYFIENQRPGFNPHDQISPYMSKTILIAHVKDGAELGLKHKLGKPIIDGILQHHGTTLISYFYNRALEEADDDHDHVEESDFRYPGPKPQFKEAALVMLADSIEAAARSLDDPTPARLQNIVRSIIQGKFLDGQLHECNLTLQDLSIIEEAFEHVILAIYHQRVEYPGQKGHVSQPRKIKPRVIS